MNSTAFRIAAILVATSILGLKGVDEPDEKRPTLAKAKAAFQKADAELNRVYREVKSLVPDWLFEELREEQKEWLAYRDEHAMSDAVFNGSRANEGREKEAVEYWESLAASTGTRVEMIRGWKAKGKDGSSETPWTGLWTDGYGGWLLLEAAADPKTVRFEIFVVRGPTAHMGSITGVARRNGEAGFFTDQGDPEYHDAAEGAETWLFFEKDPTAPRLKIRGIHTSPYHGARAYFDGTYTRLRDATPDDHQLFEQ